MTCANQSGSLTGLWRGKFSSFRIQPARLSRYGCLCLARIWPIHEMSQRRKTLRVFVTHSAQNQPWQVAEGGETPVVDFDSGRGIPSWELRIEGKLLEDVRLASSVSFHHFNAFRFRILQATRHLHRHSQLLHPENSRRSSKA